MTLEGRSGRVDKPSSLDVQGTRFKNTVFLPRSHDSPSLGASLASDMLEDRGWADEKNRY